MTAGRSVRKPGVSSLACDGADRAAVRRKRPSLTMGAGAIPGGRDPREAARSAQADKRRGRSPAGEGVTRLYTDLSAWWPLLSAPEDYEDEAALFRRVLRAHASGPLRTVLELGCGGGNNASHLKARLCLTLVDLSPGMLALSRALNPECEHVLGDMRSLDLGRQFDAVFVHDAILYMTTAADLDRTLATAFAHCRPGGAALFAPDHVRETFEPATRCGGHDGGGRSARYLEWSWDPDPADTTYVSDFAYLLRDRDGTVQCVHDRHVLGLFPRAVWIDRLVAAGFRAKAIRCRNRGIEPAGSELFVGVRPAPMKRRSRGA